MSADIGQLRSSYRDQIHPLENLSIYLPGMLIKMEYLDEDVDGVRGVFRIHPRLSLIEIWPDTESAIMTIKEQLQVEEDMMEQIYLKTIQKKARESVMKARNERKSPSSNDMSIIRDTKIRPEKTRRSMIDEKYRIIKLSEIEDAVRSVQRETNQSREARQKYLEITLRPEAPVKLARFSPVKLIVEFI